MLDKGYRMKAAGEAQDPLQLDMIRRNGVFDWGMCWRVAAMCLAFLIALAPLVPAFALAPLLAPVENPDHTVSRVAGMASPAGEAAAASTRVHRHDEEGLAIDDGASGCPAIQSIDLCMAVCCAAILSQSLDHTRMRLPGAMGFLLTIPSSASRIVSHPPPQAIA